MALTGSDILTQCYQGVSENFFGVFVGRYGDTIRTLTRQSKARIVIDKQDKRSESFPVVIGLTGTAAAIDTAKVLLLLLLLQ